MRESSIIVFDIPELDSPILVEGLPGIGNVGKLAADYLVEKLGAVKFAEIYSPHFPPQVLVRPDGTIEPMRNELYFWRGSEYGKNDFIFLLGNTQALEHVGQYEICGKIISFLTEHFDLSMIITLGGFGTGRVVEKPRVFGAATSSELVEKFEQYGVIFRSVEGRGGIVGASGLLLFFGKLRGVDGVCLLGETSGYFIDARAAREVLMVLRRAFSLDVDMSDMEKRAKEMEAFLARISEMERMAEELSRQEKRGSGEDELRYIG